MYVKRSIILIQAEFTCQSFLPKNKKQAEVTNYNDNRSKTPRTKSSFAKKLEKKSLTHIKNVINFLIQYTRS